MEAEALTEQYRDSLEHTLDDFDPAARRRALTALLHAAAGGHIALPPPQPIYNLHAHTFYSYNPEGFSPTRYAWRARLAGLEAAGIVDFDVLDGLDEFLDAGRRLGLKTCVGLESRVFVPEFADRVINSPGEPGISYHMGVGFTTSRLPREAAEFLAGMRDTAQRRNRDLLGRVNAYTAPVLLDYDEDVLPLTPNGNATERHLCYALARKAATHFTDSAALAQYWSDKLGADPAELDLPAGPGLQARIRARTMKRGGVGYVAPDRGSFPSMSDMNRFVLAAGAIPTMTWLDGTSNGEQATEELLRVGMAGGAAALNIIPDRNFTPGVKDEKLQNLYDVVALAEDRGLPIVVGTEMNSPGLRFVDDFEAPELAPVVPAFLKGMRIAYAHSVLQQHGGLGYLSPWARTHFADVREKNAFYERIGARLQPALEPRLEGVSDAEYPEHILDRIA